MYGEGNLLCRTLLCEGGTCPFIARVCIVGSVIFIEASRSVCSWHHVEGDGGWIIDHCALYGIEGDYGSGFVVDGELVQCELSPEGTVALCQAVLCDVPPESFRQPYVACADATLCGFVDGSHQDVVSEHEFIFKLVSLSFLGPFVIERTVHAYTCVIRFSGGGIEVGEESIAQAYGFSQLHEVGVFPYSAFYVVALQSMCAEDGRVYSKLQPAQVEFLVIASSLMSAYVMSPVGITYVAGIAGEVCQISQCGPFGEGVS